MTFSASASSCGTVFLTNIPNPSKKSLTSAQASTSRGQDFYAYWDSSEQAVYHRLLWLPRTGWPALDSNSLNGSVPSARPASPSWIHRMELPKRSSEKTSCQSCKFTVVDGTAGAGTAAATPARLKALKLRLNPTSAQKTTLAKMAGCYRYTYNKTIAAATARGSTHKDKYRLRDRLVTLKTRGKTATNSFFTNKPWLLECPKSVRGNAVMQAVANLKACHSNKKAGNIKAFKSPYMSKKHQASYGWTLQLDAANVKRDGDVLYVLKNVLGSIRYRRTKQLHKLIPGAQADHGCKIQKSRYNEYFLVVPVPVMKRVAQPKAQVVAVDPGVRKFLTTYSPDGEYAEWIGRGHADRILELLQAYDRLQAALAHAQCSGAVRSIQKQQIRLRRRIFYLKKEMHDQSANYLGKSYEIILMPKLDTRALSISAGRRLTTKVVRKMLSLGHSLFIERLKQKCAEYDRQLLMVTEHYTSKTCVYCGQLNQCDETYRCGQCGFICDRDVTGAAGICLRAVRSNRPMLPA